jgi:hypothetical protein
MLSQFAQFPGNAWFGHAHGLRTDDRQRNLCHLAISGNMVPKREPRLLTSQLPRCILSTCVVPAAVSRLEVAMSRFCTSSLFVVATGLVVAAAPRAALAERQCNVPAGYYRLVDLEDAGVVEFRETATHHSRLLSPLQAGEIVESDGTRAQGGGTVWQQVKILQTAGWVPARNLWRALPMTLGRSEFPVSGWCGSSEPLWSMSWNGAKLRLSLFPGRYDTDVENVQPGSSQRETLIAGKTAYVSYRVVYSDDVCRSVDGEMLGLGRAYVIVTRNGQEQLYSGCCNIASASFPKRSVPGQKQ